MEVEFVSFDLDAYNDVNYNAEQKQRSWWIVYFKWCVVDFCWKLWVNATIEVEGFSSGKEIKSELWNKPKEVYNLGSP